MSIYDPDSATLAAWGALVEKQSKGLSPDDFTGTPLRAFRSKRSTHRRSV